MPSQKRKRCTRADQFIRRHNQDIVMGVIERDPVFQANMRTTMRRGLQGKLSPAEFASIRRNLAERSLYRYIRAERVPVTTLPALTDMAVA